jgi:hypothetical protein
MFVTAIVFVLAIAVLGVAAFWVATLSDRTGERYSPEVPKLPSPTTGPTKSNRFDRISCRFVFCSVFLCMAFSTILAAALLALKYDQPRMAWVSIGCGFVFIMSWVWALNFFKHDPNRLPDHITRH